MPSTGQNRETRAVAITGMGIISAIGNTVAENLSGLRSSASGIGNLEHITTSHASEIKVGEVKMTNAELASMLHLTEEHNYTRTALLGAIAAKEALHNSGADLKDTLRTGLISSTTVGGMDMTEKYFKEFTSRPGTRKYINSHLAGDSTQKIAAQLGITGFVTTVSTACSSAANAIMLGTRLIKAGKLDRVVVGGTDALSKFTINGFKSLMILSDEACAPFDAHRKGLNLGEGAAYLILESEAVAKREKRYIMAWVRGYGNANDAFHQTASSPTGDGAYMAMKEALKTANLNAADIDYINAHGTATMNNDLSESEALIRIFGDHLPSFSSTKSFTGHTLAAAGAVEAVFSVLALQEQTVFPNLNFSTAIAKTQLIPETRIQKKKIRNILSNSFGFGGNCTSLIFGTL
ncbi:beta-ketoacyl-[acyl-carrier-protein] synthase family protein [Constantimarinum furrinae]|uniref:Beta-ACP synthase n=1 Tax=Constantimarinum furrinae TaxID=2562285 RepID=A0A7G8PTX2_9FLAO|nr:beta-ketoacyl-[acyl-carrier-protein] synthase family protein [Constantimarinum furrinae]QNJ97788.1 beta-ACP synthase [Constantimarinum furrinae]